MKLAIIKAAPIAAALAFAAAPAHAIDFTYCDTGGTPYCDGVSLNFYGSTLTVNGAHTGCHTGTVYGTIAYLLANRGTGAAWGFGDTSAYTGLYTSEVTLAPPYPWRLINQTGAIQNTGNMCFGLPAVTASTAPSAAGI